MNRIKSRGISKHYDKDHALKGINPVIEDGEFMTLLGPSGCNKTTILRVVVGLEKPQKGYIYMEDKETVSAFEELYEGPGKHHLDLVLQPYVLWPHVTVFGNVAFGLKVTKMSEEGIRKKVENALKCMRIGAFIGRYLLELSGEQQQCVAIARAIVSEPEVLFLDELLSNPDAKLRIEMGSKTKRLHQELGTTIIYVIHDQTEALTMSIKIVIFFESVLERVAPPMELHQNSASLRVVDFIGNPKVNFLPGRARASGDVMTVESVLEIVTSDKKFSTGKVPGDGGFEVVVGVRSGLVEIPGGPVGDSIEVEIYSATPAGSETTIYLEVGGGRILSKQNGLKQYSPDQKVWLWINPDRMNVFSRDSGKLAKLAVVDAQKDE